METQMAKGLAALTPGSTQQLTRQSKTEALQTYEELTRSVFDAEMIKLSAAKNQQFHAHTLEVWFNQMRAMRWSAQKFRFRVLSVMQMQQIRVNITFDDFIHAPPAMDREVLEDAKKLMQKMIDHRKEEYIAMNKGARWDFSRAAEAGVISVQEMFANAWSLKVDEAADSILKRCVAARKFISSMSAEEVKKLYDDMVVKKIIPPIEVALSQGLAHSYVRGFFPSGSGLDKRFPNLKREYLFGQMVGLLDEVERLMSLSQTKKEYPDERGE